MTSSKLRFRAYFDDVVQQMVIQYAEDLFIQGKKDEAKEILETALELMTSANQANIDCEYISIFSRRLVHRPRGHYQQIAKGTQFSTESSNFSTQEKFLRLNGVMKEKYLKVVVLRRTYNQ